MALALGSRDIVCRWMMSVCFVGGPPDKTITGRSFGGEKGREKLDGGSCS